MAAAKLVALAAAAATVGFVVFVRAVGSVIDETSVSKPSIERGGVMEWIDMAVVNIGSAIKRSRKKRRGY